MGFVDTIITFASGVVSIFGAGVAVNGFVDYGQGKSQQNAGKQDEGMSKIIGGIIIIAVGFLLVPQISTLIPS